MDDTLYALIFGFSSLFVCGAIACLCVCCCCLSLRILRIKVEIKEEDSEEVETGENCEELPHLPHTYGHPHPPDQVWSIGLEYGIESQGNMDLDNLAPPSYDEAVQSQKRF